MNKETFSRYGSIIAMVLVLAVMITFAAPFGNAIASGVNNFVNGFGDAMNGNAGGGGGSGSSGIKLDAPTNLALTNNQLSFDLVPNANQYILYVNDEVSATYATSPIDVSTYIETYGTPITFKLVASDSTGTYGNSAATEYTAAGDGKMILKAGTYRFNDTPSIPNNFEQSIVFTITDGTQIVECNAMSVVDNTIADRGDGITYNTKCLKYSMYIADYNSYFSIGVYNECESFKEWSTSLMAEDILRNTTLAKDTEVDDTFGTWFISNTNYNEVNSIVIEEMTIVDGKYVFDKAQFAGSNSFEYTGFTFASNSQTFHGIKLEPYNEGASVYWLYYINEDGTYTQVAFQDGSWNTNWDYGDGYKTIEFDDETQVPAELKQWLDESASYYNVVLDGEWVFEEIPTKFPENSYVEIPVNATLKSDPSKIITTITITSNIMQEGTTDVNTRSIVFYDADSNVVLEYNDGYVYAPDYDLDLSFDKEWSAAGEENRTIIFEEQLTSEEHFMMIAYNADRVEVDNAESVLELRRFKETMTPINDVPLPNTVTQDEVLPYCFDVEGEVTIGRNTYQVTKISCLLTVNNLANTGTYNAICYFFTVDGEIGAELGYMNDNYIDEAFNIPFAITNTNGFDEWLLANTEPVEQEDDDETVSESVVGTWILNEETVGLDVSEYQYFNVNGYYQFYNPYADVAIEFDFSYIAPAYSHYVGSYGPFSMNTKLCSEANSDGDYIGFYADDAVANKLTYKGTTDSIIARVGDKYYGQDPDWYRSTLSEEENVAVRTFTVTGGADANKKTLVTWLKANAKRVIEADELPTEDIDTDAIYKIYEYVDIDSSDPTTLKTGTYRFIKTPDLSVELSQVFNFTVFYKTVLAGDTVVDSLAKELLVESDGLTFKADEEDGSGEYSYGLYLNPIPEGYEQYYEDGWGLGYVAEIELNDTEVDETFGTWFIENAKVLEEKYYQYVDGAWVEQQP